MLIIFLVIVKCQSTFNLTIGIDIAQKDSLAYLGKLEQYYDQLKEKGLSLTILNHILPCYTCQSRHNYTIPEPNCYGGGRYCQFSPYANGQLLLKEMIRQTCLFNDDVSIFLSYINQFQQQCIDNPNYNNCSSNILKVNLKYDITKLDECINFSFQGEGDQALIENKILAKEMKQYYNQSKLTVYLNDQDISNKKFGEMIMDFCHRFEKDPPKYCVTHLLVIKSTQTSLNDEVCYFLFTVILIIVILISVRILIKMLLKQKNNTVEETSMILK